MHFHTLENLSTTDLCSLFNKAFADYFVKIELTPEFFQNKLASEDIDLNLSVGAFHEGQPVGFILHAFRAGIAYNGGTGVVPEFRGRHLTQKMYAYILPKLKKKGASEILLEVIDKNIQAIKSYQQAGFEKVVELNCYKGKAVGKPINLAIEIAEVEQPDFELIESFWDWQPTWQHSSLTLKKLYDYKCLGAFMANELAGYVYYYPEKGRVAQFAVDPRFRKKGVASTLFQHLSKRLESELFVINVDGSHATSGTFLKSIGLEPFLTQHKMKRTI